MNNISFDELKNMAESVPSAELLEMVSGGTENELDPDGWAVNGGG